MKKDNNITKQKMTKALESYSNSGNGNIANTQEVVRDTNVVITLPNRQQRLELSMLNTIEDILDYLCSKLANNIQQELSVESIRKITSDIVNKIENYEHIVKTNGVIRSRKYINIIELSFKLTDKYRVDNSIIKQALSDSQNQQEYIADHRQDLTPLNKPWRAVSKKPSKYNSENDDTQEISNKANKLFDKYKLMRHHEMRMKLQQVIPSKEFYNDMQVIRSQCLQLGLENVVLIYDDFIAKETTDRQLQNTINKNSTKSKESNSESRYDQVKSISDMHLV